MCGMRKEDESEDIPLFAEVQKLQGKMRAMAIKEQKPLLASSAILGVFLEKMKPINSKLIIRIPGRRYCDS